MKLDAKKIWQNKKLILEGIKNSIFQKDAVEEIAQHRLEICNGCKLIDREGSECMVSGTQPCCGNCGCSLKLKTRSLASECPIGLWAAVLTDTEELEHDLLNEETND